MSNRIQITICLGSSCFKNQNREVVDVVQDYVKKNNLTEKINIAAGHCFGECTKGPIIRINNQIYTNITPQKAIEIINRIVNNLL